MPVALAGFAAAAFIVGVLCSRFHHDVMRIYEAKDRLRLGGVLLDIDRAGDFAARHPRLAVNIPLDELGQRARELGARSRPVVIYAHHWRDGVKAAHLLRSLGFQDVYDAAGVRVREKLSEAAAHAAAGRVYRDKSRGIPDDIDLTPETT